MSGRKAAVQSLPKLVTNVNELISLNFNLELVTKMRSRASALRQSKWRDCELGEFILGVERYRSCVIGQQSVTRKVPYSLQG